MTLFTPDELAEIERLKSEIRFRPTPEPRLTAMSTTVVRKCSAIYMHEVLRMGSMESCARLVELAS